MSSIRKKTLFATVVASLLVVAAGHARAETAVKLHLDWLINGYHAPFFVAQEMGWYKDAGLDVTIVPGKGSFDSVRAVASGNAEFGFPDAATASKAIAEGLPLKMVAVFLQETPMGVVAFADKGIEKPQDLEGRTLSNVPEASTAKVLPAFFKSAGVDADKITLVSHTFATAVPSVLSEQVDAGTGYVFGEYLAIKNGAGDRDVNWIGFADYGVQLYSNGIAVNTAFLNGNPDAVRGFVQASVRALEWTAENPDKAIEIVAKHTETAPETLKEQLMVALPLMVTDEAKANGLGRMSPEKWAETQRIMVEHAGQPSVVPDSDLYSNEFLK